MFDTTETSHDELFHGIDEPGETTEVLRPDESEQLRGLLYEIKKVIVGQDRLLEGVLIALLANGHCLLEGPPGLAKTLTVRALAHTVGADFSRVQFTPDLVPSDIVGTRIYRATQEHFDTELGPIFANFVLADEINRAPAKVQSALLESMGERQVTIGGETYRLPRPFLVLATQNPIESAGVYELPEAQRDRFLFKLNVDYPNHQEELEVVRRMTAQPPRLGKVFTPRDLLRLQGVASEVYVEPAVMDYAVRLVLATRHPEDVGVSPGYIAFGASPRASIGLIRAARAFALLQGRGYALPGDVLQIAPDVLRHRLVLTYEALADEVTPDALIDRVLLTVPQPRQHLDALAEDAQGTAR